MTQHLKFILTISAIICFTLALVLDVTSFGQFLYDFWQNVSLTRILLITSIILVAGLLFGLFLFHRKKYKQRIALTVPIAFIIFSLIDISKIAISYYGLDEEYNYFTAK